LCVDYTVADVFLLGRERCRRVTISEGAWARVWPPSALRESHPSRRHSPHAVKRAMAELADEITVVPVAPRCAFHEWNFGLMLLLCLRQAVESGFYPSLKDTPFAVRAASRAVAGAEGGCEASGSGARGSADPAPAEYSEVQRAHVANTHGQIVCSVLCDWSTLRAVIPFPLLGQPQMKSSLEGYASLKARSGTYERWRAISTCYWESRLLALSLQFSVRSFLQDR
jgi:hypothetical protein